MGEVVVERSPLYLLSTTRNTETDPQSLQFITIIPSNSNSNSYIKEMTESTSTQHYPEEGEGGGGGGGSVGHGSTEFNPQDAWLPITESRKGNVYSSTFHILCSGIGIQALLLPLAFGALGWAWGIICLSIAFVWQLYTIWLLVHLHESVPGTRYSRYLHLSIASFGVKLGKILAIFPIMYLSGGTCVMLIITGGGTMARFFELVYGDGDKPLNGAEWFLMFTCLAIVVAQLPNLNSIALVSLVGAITAVCYCTLIWVLSIIKGRPQGVSYGPSNEKKSDMAGMCDVLNAIGIIFLAFRGHNVVLEIQGTLPSNPKHASHKPMWRGVTASYLVIAMCLFPLAVAGFWAYGNKMPTSGGMLKAFSDFHGHSTSTFVLGLIYLLVVINSLSTFQVYAMVVFDNLELRYISKKKQRCPPWVRLAFRLFFGGVAFFVAVAIPFLHSLAALVGGMALPLTFAYPCFMWIAIKRPCPYSANWCLNLVLGCFGIVLSVLLVVAALWNLVTKGIDANFFNPHLQ